jgi:O-antigen ligase
MRIDFTKAINYTVLLYAFFLPLSRAAIVGLTFFIILFWVLEGNFKEKYKKIANCNFLIALLIFILFSFLSLFWVEKSNLPDAVNYLRKYWYIGVVFPIYTSLYKDNILKVIYLFIAGMSLSVILSWGIYLDLWEIKDVLKKHLSVFMYFVVYSLFLSISALFTISLAKNSKKKTLKYLYSILTLLFLGVLFLNISRSGQVIFVITTAILLIRYYTYRKKVLVGSFFVLALLLIGFYSTNNSFKTRVGLVKQDIVEIIDHDNYCTSLGGRAFTWKVASDIVSEHPLIGVGIADHLEYLYNKMQSDKSFSNCHLQNMIKYYHGQYIEILTQMGIIGLILFLSIFYYLVKIRINDKLISDIQIIFVVAFLLFFIVDMPFRRQFCLAVFGLISGIIIREKSFEASSDR